MCVCVCVCVCMCVRVCVCVFNIEKEYSKNGRLTHFLLHETM